MRCFLLAFFLINFVLISASHAMYAVPQVEQVPVERLLKNLSARQKEAKIDQEKAMLAFQIGRLHSMAYALKTGTASVASNSVGTAAELPFYGVGFSDYRQFGVADSKDSAQKTKAKEHLESAIHHLREAVKLDPSLAQAKLSLAWCLDESGNKKEALAYYRPLFRQFFEREKRGGFLGGSVAAETGGYMLKILDPGKDADEISDIKSKMAQLDRVPRAMTPIVIPLAPNVVSSELMTDAIVSFDLDGRGKRRYSQWPSRRAGWLVYDQKGKGEVTSGLELFGQSTFWIFWRNGYEALAALDDDGDGKLEGDELRNLGIWCDANQNGVSEPGEIRSLADCGIVSLSCRYVGGNGMPCGGKGMPIGGKGLPFSDKQMPFSAHGVTFRNGETAATYDWIVEECPLQ